MTIEKDEIIYELYEEPVQQNITQNGNASSSQNSPRRFAKIIKCLSNDTIIEIPHYLEDPSTTTTSQSQTASNQNNLPPNGAYIVNGISSWAFKGCENLQILKFKESDNITYIGKSAFENCVSLKEFTIPSKINRIKSKCFFNCLHLKSVKQDSNIYGKLIIEESAFENCFRLADVNFDNSGLERIERKAFKNCLKLKLSKNGVKNYDTVIYIHEEAFENCAATNIITGSQLRYSNGKNFSSINSRIERGTFEFFPKAYLWIFLALAIILIFVAFLNNDGLVLLFTGLIYIDVTVYLFHKSNYTKKTAKNNSFKYAYATFSSLIIISLLQTITSVETSDFLLSSFDLKKIDTYTYQVENIVPYANYDFELINSVKTPYNPSDRIIDSDCSNQIISFNSNDKNCIRIINNINPILISKLQEPFDLNAVHFEFNNDKDSISVISHCDSQLYYKTENDETVNMLDSDNGKYSIKIAGSKKITLFINVNNENIEVLDFICDKVKKESEDSSNNITNGLKQLFSLAFGVFLLLLIISLIKWGYKGVAPHEVMSNLFSIVPIILYVILSLAKKADILEILKNIIAAG